MAYNIHYRLFTRGSFTFEGIKNQSVNPVFICYLCSVRKDAYLIVTPQVPIFCVYAQVVLSWACSIAHFRMGAMPLMRVLLVAILPLLSTLPPRWRATSLTLMMTDTQPYTGQSKRVSCPWWSTSWDPVDLTWKQGTRLVHICVGKYHVNVCLC